MTDKKVYSAIVAIAGDLAEHGIEKSRKNQQQGYAFRGIDEIYNHLAPLLSKHGLCILPQVEERDVVERVNKSGNPLFYVTVRVRFQFVSREDGSSHDVITYGEAMDSADKATNKAMSAAYKYACLQAFCIPTEGDNDADATTHEVAPAKPKVTPEEAAKLFMAKIAKAQTEAELKKITDGEQFKRLIAELDSKQEKADLMNAVTAQYAVLDEKAEAFKQTTAKLGVNHESA